MSKRSQSTDLAGIRDTVESIWVAIVLAFVLRAFLVEGFVIPTGSMAPRLMGEHWQLQCSGCGYEYAYGFQQELPGQARINRAVQQTPAGARCPNCGRLYNEGAEPIDGGDRVLVLKYLYNFRPPQPWDVVVFRNPQNNRENYIKRLVGLPGETLEIVHGDLFVAPGPQGPWSIRRKPARAQQAMWQVVYDNDYVPTDAARRARWAADQEAFWQVQANGRSLTYLGGSSQTQWLRLLAPPQGFLPHYGYNAEQVQDRWVNPALDVCTDLKLLASFTPLDAASQIGLHLTSFEHRFRGLLSASGQASLLYQRADWPEQRWEVLAQTSTAPIPTGRSVEAALENVDQALRLRVNGRCVLEVLDRYPMDYPSLKRRLASGAVPVPEARIAAGGRARLTHLRVYRDVYYSNVALDPVPGGPLGDYARSLGLEQSGPGWGTTGHPITLAKFPGQPDLDQFWVLGDNSPQSLDGRAWTSAAPTLRLRDASGRPAYQLGAVPRYSLTGRAFFVYWPSGMRPPGLPNLPLIPDVGRMRLIR
jgi:signal peptidase I